MQRRNFMRIFEAKAYALHDTANPLFTPKARPLDRSLALGLILISLALVLTITAVVFGPYLSLKTIKITGYSSLNPETVSLVIKQQFNKKSWLILPNSHRWFFNLAKAEQELMGSFPLKSVELSKHGANLDIALIEDIFMLAFRAGNDTFILDRSGQLVRQAEGEEIIPPGIPMIRDKTGTPYELGSQVFSDTVISGIIDFDAGLRQQGIVPLEYVSDDTSLSWLAVTSNQGYLILFDATQPITTQLLALQTVRSKYLATQESPNYVDLRFGARVYTR